MLLQHDSRWTAITVFKCGRKECAGCDLCATVSRTKRMVLAYAPCFMLHTALDSTMAVSRLNLIAFSRREPSTTVAMRCSTC